MLCVSLVRSLLLPSHDATRERVRAVPCVRPYGALYFPLLKLVSVAKHFIVVSSRTLCPLRR